MTKPVARNKTAPMPKTESEITSPSQVSLAEIMAQLPSTDEKKNIQNAHRVEVITSVAQIDDCLLRLLQTVLTPAGTDGNKDSLLDEGGVIGTLKLRAKTCLRLGLISPTLHNLIKDLANIRNECSHKPAAFDVFTDQSICDKINAHWNRMNTDLFKESIVQPNERFKELCRYIDILLRIVTKESSAKVFLNNEIIFRKNT